MVRKDSISFVEVIETLNFFKKMHKAGFVSIIGKPNVGKSTLLNCLLGESLSIVSSKAQTTRHRIKGIYNDEHYQVVFSDTPGLIDPHYPLQEKMMNFLKDSLEDADLIVYVSELGASVEAMELDMLRKLTVPVIVVLNKVDLSNQEKLLTERERWKKTIQPYAIVPVSALKEFNTSALLDLIKEALPECPPYYDKEDLSDLNERFFVAEIIREKIFLNFKEEIPYSVEVVVDSFKEKEGIIHIGATVYTERDSQKAILIGKNGDGIKRIGTDARKHIEKFLQRKVHLALFVKVEKDWRKDEKLLKKFGYDPS